MAIEDILERAKLAGAQYKAALGAVDHPQAIIYDLFGIHVYPGEKVVDTVTGEEVEVVDAGIETVNPEEAGA